MIRSRTLKILGGSLLYLGSLIINILLGFKNNTIFISVLMVGMGSIVLWVTFYKLGKGKAFLCFLNFLVLYIVLNIGTIGYGKYVEYKLSQFDLNGDSIFSKDEQTYEQQKYMDIKINDISRKLMLLSGAVISVVSSFFFWVIIVISEKIQRIRKSSTG